MYLLEYTSLSDGPALLKINLTDECSFLLTHLSPKTSYEVKLRGIGKYGQIGEIISREFNTVSRSAEPAMVDLIQLVEIKGEGQNFASVRLNWSSSPTLPCQYSLVLWKNSSSSHAEIKQVTFPEPLNEKVYSELEYETSYQFGVVAKVGPESESNTTWFRFNISSCMAFYPGNLSICPPLPPSGVIVDQLPTPDDPGGCRVRVGWDQEGATPAHYTLTLFQYDFTDKSRESHVHKFNVSGEQRSTVLSDLEVGSNYLLLLIAVDEAGHSHPARVDLQDFCAGLNSDSRSSFVKEGIFSVSLLALFSVSCFILISFSSFLLYCHKRKSREQHNCDHKKPIKRYSPCSSDLPLGSNQADEYEIPNDSLLVSDKIGEGAFGVVYKGLLSKSYGAPEEVAVKMLRDEPTAEECRQFQKEIALMKIVGKHKNIVSLIGCCTLSHRLMLIVEFCALGDLQNYLRKEWKNQQIQAELVPRVKPSESIEYAHLMVIHSNEGYAKPITKFGGMSPGIVSNASYELNIQEQENVQKGLSLRLISFCRQIAIGMEFLSSNRVVHRDLAARNVLVCTDECIKISDFGLSRDIYEQNMYCKKSSEKLPIKWMALESLLHQVYTTQSDVWSFGVLLWEIVTLGGNPYPTTPTNQMFRLLKHGYRMEQPPSCSNELFGIMSSCWREKPVDRPKFATLVEQLTQLLESTSPHQYLDLSQVWGSEERETVPSS